MSFSYYSTYKINKDRIIELAVPSPFGKGDETIYDENIRKALEISSERIEGKLVFEYKFLNSCSDIT